MTVLSLDIETYSSVDLKKAGLYAYTQSPDFTILLLGFAFDDQPVQVVDLAQSEDVPTVVMYTLLNPGVLKTAWNAAFERTCLAEFFNLELPPESWACSMVHSYYLGLPGSLDATAKTMNLSVQKDAGGKALIRHFAVPCKPTKTNGGRTRNLPEHAPEKWESFKAYCGQDVEVEREIRHKLERFPVPRSEQRLWALDQRINDYGVRVDHQLVAHAIRCDSQYQEKLLTEAVRLTGLDNPNSVAQLKTWLLEAEGLEIDSLNKESVPVLLEQVEGDSARRVLELRQEMSKTSVKKYQTAQRALCPDGRVRGLLQFYGANRTGRWAGRLIQVQNLRKNSLADLDTARRFLLAGDYEVLEMLYDSVPDVLSQLIRTMFIPSEGNRLIAADFSAIEARVIAWLAGERWRMDVFKGDGRIYEASAAQMFKVPVESIDKGSPLRQKGKIAELALGYGGGPGALIAMGALDMGLTEAELPTLVKVWRQANPAITQFWYDLDRAAITAVQDRLTVRLQYGITFRYESGALCVRLPSGRDLFYVRPRVEEDPKFGRPGITYEGQEQGRWGRQRTYGGKWAENLTQAVARDCLAEALMRLEDAGYQTAFHVHDECCLDVPLGTGSVDEVVALMSEPISWAPGLPLTAAGYSCEFYRKD